jgi:hypothetical protein
VRCGIATLLIVVLAGFASIASAGERAAGAGHALSLIDLRRANWREVVVPGRVCGTGKPVQLREKDAAALAHSTRWPQYRRIIVAGSSRPDAYGDLNGDGHDEAALQVDCANLGGTAGGQLAFAVVVYRPGRHVPVPIAVLTPQIRGDRHFHVPLIYAKAIAQGRVVTMEAFYGPRDGDCCASGLARTVWHLRGDRPVPASTVVLRRPKR